jgi:hypothetical protein
LLRGELVLPVQRLVVAIHGDAKVEGSLYGAAPVGHDRGFAAKWAAEVLHDKRGDARVLAIGLDQPLGVGAIQGPGRIRGVDPPAAGSGAHGRAQNAAGELGVEV